MTSKLLSFEELSNETNSIKITLNARANGKFKFIYVMISEVHYKVLR